MFCVKCGRSMPNDVKFCPFCGELNQMQYGQVPSTENQVQMTTFSVLHTDEVVSEKQELPRVGSKKKTAIIVLTICTIVIGIIVGISQASKPKSILSPELRQQLLDSQTAQADNNTSASLESPNVDKAENEYAPKIDPSQYSYLYDDKELFADIDNIITEYRNNNYAAGLKYTDKIIVVAGYIDGIYDHRFYMKTDSNSFDSDVEVDIGDWDTWEEWGFSEIVASMHEGDYYIVTGLIYEYVFGQICIKPIKIEKPTASNAASPNPSVPMYSQADKYVGNWEDNTGRLCQMSISEYPEAEYYSVEVNWWVGTSYFLTWTYDAEYNAQDGTLYCYLGSKSGWNAIDQETEFYYDEAGEALLYFGDDGLLYWSNYNGPRDPDHS